MKQNISLIVMSAGKSSRFREKTRIKKHWVRVENKPIWLYVADTLQNRYHFNKVVITSSQEDLHYMKKFCSYDIVLGGESRQDSVINALNAISSEFVAISDAARFGLDFDVLDTLFNYDLNNVDCLVPTININDTIFMESNNIKTYLPRDCIHLVQTPQISRLSTLKKALKDGNFSDESSAINKYGGRVVTIKGSKKLNKLTYFDDLSGFNIDSCNDVFTGYGFDVHRFCENKEMFLGGVRIDCDFGLEAHSDGDVVIHALCDALLGGIGGGDIGEWFPPDDDKYSNIDSKILLNNVVDFVFSVGFQIINVDIMIMAQKPKILPYKDEMLEIFSNILGIRKNYINIKATTMEKLGFIGRQEGICASANVSLKFNNFRNLL